MLVCMPDATNETVEGVLGDLLTDLDQGINELLDQNPEVFYWV